MFPSATTATLAEVEGELLRLINRPTRAGGSGIFPTSGDQYLSVNAGEDNRLLVTFADPVAAFGFYGVDVGDQGAALVLDFFAADQLVASVPAPTPVSVVDGDTSGSVLFFGVITTNPSMTFTRVEFGSSRSDRFDGFGFDDFTVGSLEQVTPVPAPSPGAAGLLLLPAVARLRRRYRRLLGLRD